MRHGVLIAAVVLGLVGVAAAEKPARRAEKDDKATPAGRGGAATRRAAVEPHRVVPGVPADANGFPTGPLPPRSWKLTDRATEAERQGFENGNRFRESMARSMAEGKSKNTADILAAAKAGKVVPTQKEPRRERRGVFTYKTEADRQEAIAEYEETMAIGKRLAWQAYDPDYFPPAFRPEAMEPVKPAR
jgi:hypothetical protein